MIAALQSLVVASIALGGHGDPADARADAPLIFVAVEANVGGASGGHLALRVGDLVYHFQQADGGLLRLVRDDWIGFRHVYAGLQNRTLHLARLDVAAADIERVARRFALAYVEQELDLERARRRRDDARWFEALCDHAALPPLRGAGLFVPSPTQDVDGASLRDDVAAALGADFVRDESARIDGALLTFHPAADATDLDPLRELLTMREALRAILEARPLAPDVVVDAVDDAGDGEAAAEALTPEERTGLRCFRDAQSAAILALLQSGCDDRGFALMVAIARHRAMSRSLRTGRWIVLDPFPDDAPRFLPEDESDRDTQRRLARRASTVAATIRAALFDGGPFDEASFNALEDILSRRREARRGGRGEAARWHDGRMVPSRGRSVALPEVARLRGDCAGLAAHAAAARAASAACDRDFRARHAYALLDRNCVTELIRLLNSSFADDVAVATALGARLVPGARFAFIPFVFQDQVVSKLRLAGQDVILSHRLDALAQLEESQPGLLTSLREATTLSSTIYVPRMSDGEFLFFTDDVVWQRPLRGVVNLGFGLGQGLVGVLTAPFDGGRRCRAGFHGALFSLPELVFGCVRKGSFGFVDEPPSAK